MPLPNTILIGVQKAGTSSLYDWISQHPEVCGNVSVKDFPFFINNKFYNKGLDYLSRIFSSYFKNEKIVFHGNVQYIFNTVGLKRIQKDIPNPKFILILRNPVDRLFSSFNYFKKMHLEDEDDILVASIEKRKERENSNDFVIRHGLTYIEHGLYAKQLQEFYKYFKPEQLHVCYFEDLTLNKERIIKDIYRFLDIADNFIPDFKIKNKTGKVRSDFLQSIFFKKNNLRKFIVDNLIDPFLPLHKRTELRWKLKELNTKKGGKNERYELSETDRKILSKYFLKDTEELEKILNVDLSNWKILY
jgi:hypothetical protein